MRRHIGLFLTVLSMVLLFSCGDNQKEIKEKKELADFTNAITMAEDAYNKADYEQACKQYLKLLSTYFSCRAGVNSSQQSHPIVSKYNPADLYFKTACTMSKLGKNNSAQTYFQDTLRSDFQYRIPTNDSWAKPLLERERKNAAPTVLRKIIEKQTSIGGDMILDKAGFESLYGCGDPPSIDTIEFGPNGGFLVKITFSGVRATWGEELLGPKIDSVKKHVESKMAEIYQQLVEAAWRQNIVIDSISLNAKGCYVVSNSPPPNNYMDDVLYATSLEPRKLKQLSQPEIMKSWTVTRNLFPQLTIKRG